MLCEALTGELPIGAFERPKEMVEGTPDELDGLLMRLLSPRPE